MFWPHRGPPCDHNISAAHVSIYNMSIIYQQTSFLFIRKSYPLFLFLFSVFIRFIILHKSDNLLLIKYFLQKKEVQGMYKSKIHDKLVKTNLLYLKILQISHSLNHSSVYFPILQAMYCWTTHNYASAWLIKKSMYKLLKFQFFLNGKMIANIYLVRNIVKMKGKGRHLPDSHL